MGYTHYWNPREGTSVAPEVWAKITHAVEGVLRIATVKGIRLVGPSGEAGTEPVVNWQEIGLNGKPGCETLFLRREPKPAPWRAEDPEFACFAFCKTRQNPYDVVVTAILVILEHFTDGAFRVASDGEPHKWKAGLELAREIVPGAQIPPGVMENAND